MTLENRQMKGGCVVRSPSVYVCTSSDEKLGNLSASRFGGKVQRGASPEVVLGIDVHALGNKGSDLLNITLLDSLV